MQGRYEIEISSGATYRNRIIPALTVDGVETPYDLDGARFTLYIRDDRRMRFAEYELDVVYDEAIGADVVSIFMSDYETSKYVPHRRYYYVIDMIHPSGDVERILDGALRVRPFTGARNAAGA